MRFDFDELARHLTSHIDDDVQQARVVEATGISPSALSRFASRQSGLDVHHTLSLCKYLSLDPMTMIKETP